MESLRTLAGERRLLMVGDSKLVSYPNLAAMINAGVDFIAPASKTYVPAATLARCELAAATAVEYLAGRDSAKKPEDRGSYRASEDTMTLAGRHKRARPLRLRRIFGHSTARAGAPAPAAVTDGVATLARSRRVAAKLRTQISQEHNGKPALASQCDQAALEAEA